MILTGLKITPDFVVYPSKNSGSFSASSIFTSSSSDKDSSILT